MTSWLVVPVWASRGSTVRYPRENAYAPSPPASTLTCIVYMATSVSSTPTQGTHNPHPVATTALPNGKTVLTSLVNKATLESISLPSNPLPNPPTRALQPPPNSPSHPCPLQRTRHYENLQSLIRHAGFPLANTTEYSDNTSSSPTTIPSLNYRVVKYVRDVDSDDKIKFWVHGDHSEAIAYDLGGLI